MAEQSKGNGYPKEITRDVLQAFEQPFPEIKWRPQQIKYSKKTQKTYGFMMAYIDARDVQNRLNEVVGPGGWSFTWKEVPAGNIQYVEPGREYQDYQTGETRKKPDRDIRVENYVVKGTLTVLGNVKEDVGYPNSADDKNPIKSAVSDALKRCGVQFGIGKFLYDLGTKIIEYDPKTKQPVDPNDLKKLEHMFKPVGRVENKE